MPVSAYATVAKVRAKQLPTRVALAVFLALSAWMLAPSIWPLVWFAVMLTGQVVDWAVFRSLARGEVERLTPWREAACVASAAVNTAVYSAIAAYMWQEGGQAGMVFAMVQVAGGLLHVALHMHDVRKLLLAASFPHAAYLFGLPIMEAASAPHDHVVPMAIVLIGAALYVAHMVAAVRQTRATQAELKAARQRAEEASNAKSDFLATVSHEIRTPMNAVISGANLLKRTELTLEQREHVGMLLNAGDVLMALLNDVLDLSKIEAGKMTVELEVVDLQERLEGLVRLWRPRAEVSGVSLRLEAGHDLPPYVLGDSLKVQQVLFNLLGNAVKFTEHGEIVLCCGHAGNRLWFEVRDTGCGMAREQLDHVFESFVQASTPEMRSGGTGLGLAISRRLAELMGGSLTAKSAHGLGSTFRLELPLIEAAAPSIPEKATALEPACTDGECLSVLVVEDHPVNQRIVALFLEPLGWRLTQAWNGAEAVEACQVEQFDVILMDMQMPVMDGLTATRTLRSHAGPNARTPIVALTAAALTQSQQAWAAAGVEAFLTKPIHPEALVDTLTAVARREYVLPQAAAA